MRSVPDRARVLERKLHIQSKRPLHRYTPPEEAAAAAAKHEKSLRDSISRNRSASYDGQPVHERQE